MSYTYVIMVFGNDIGKIINSFYSEYTESKGKMLVELKDFDKRDLNDYFDRKFTWNDCYDDCRFCTIEGLVNGFVYDRKHEERYFNCDDTDDDYKPNFYYIINPLVCSELRFRARKLLTA